jgi:UDP:flavonoid glycosyltransferase YjiC (YdhE family)
VARILCAWEFGRDLGHIRRLLPVARELRAMGHHVAFALRDSRYLHMALAEGFDAFPAPLLRAPERPSPTPVNFSDILLNLGFDDRPALAGALRAWSSLLALLAPDVVVADYAPTAMAAAQAAGIPRVTIGTGFALPPLRDPLPAIRPWLRTDDGVLRALDDRVMNSIRAVFPGDASRAPRQARDLFDADAHLLCTFPELDPFGARDGVEYLGPQNDAATGVEIAWRSTEGPRVFAYLKPGDARFAALLAGLQALTAEVIVAAPGLAPAVAEAAATESLRVASAPVKLQGLLEQATLCISHGGAGLTARAFVAGVPMALLPMHLEQFLVASRLQEAGCAALSTPEEAAPDFKTWIAALLVRDDLRQAAARHAAAHRGHSFADAARVAARRVEQAAGPR